MPEAGPPRAERPTYGLRKFLYVQPRLLITCGACYGRKYHEKKPGIEASRVLKGEKRRNLEQDSGAKVFFAFRMTRKIAAKRAVVKSNPLKCPYVSLTERAKNEMNLGGGASGNTGKPGMRTSQSAPCRRKVRATRWIRISSCLPPAPHTQLFCPVYVNKFWVVRFRKKTFSALTKTVNSFCTNFNEWG